MTAFEYVLSCIKANEEDFEEKGIDSYFIPDEKIQLLSEEWPRKNIMNHHLNMDLLHNLFEDERYGCTIRKSDMVNMKKTELHIDENIKEWLSDVKYPYYRIRGKKIPAKLAKELVLTSKELWEELGLINFLHDFIFEDGTVGINSTTSEYPHIMELLADSLKLKKKIPCLNMIIAISNWDNMPDEAWEKFMHTDDVLTNQEYREYDEYTGEFNEYENFEKNRITY